jgi:hypothetical protein
MHAVVLALALLQEPRTAPDRLTPLNTGREEEVTLLHLGAKEVDFLDAQGKMRTQARKRLRNISGPRSIYPEFAARLTTAYSDQASADDAFAFALWCREQGFLRDADLACWRAIAINPGHAAAHLALGHTGSGEVWLIPLGDGRVASWDEAQRLHSAPDLPWQLTTMHFSVAVNGPLDRAVICAAAAEMLYARTWELLSERARLWDLQRPIAVRVWPSRKQGYPDLDPQLEGYWDPGTAILHTWLDSREGPARPHHYERLLAEAMLERAAVELTRSPAEIPAWLHEGFGIVLEASTVWGSGLPACTPALAAQKWVSHHAAARPQRSAGQVAVLARADFGSPVADDLRAHCYTLLHFLLFHAAPEHDAPFRHFLHQSFRNLGGGSRLRQSFGAAFENLEKEWQAWVALEAAPHAGER